MSLTQGICGLIPISEISFCMIARNAEGTIGRALEGVKQLASEIIVVDTGSTDTTKEIALAGGATVLEWVWVDDFSKARNFAFQQCTKKWILYWDSDEFFSNWQDFKRCLETMTPKEDTLCVEVDMAWGGLSYRRVVLVRNNGQVVWKYQVHECLVYNFSKKEYWSGVVLTQMRKKVWDVDRNMRILTKALKECTETGHLEERPRYLFYLARELRDRGKLKEAEEGYEEYLKESNWLPERLQACIDMANMYLDRNLMEPTKRWTLRSLMYSEECYEAYVLLGIVAFREQRWKDCVRWCKTALETPLKNVLFRNIEREQKTPYELLAVCYQRRLQT